MVTRSVRRAFRRALCLSVSSLALAFALHGFAPEAVHAQGTSFPTTIAKTGSQFKIARLKYEGGSDWYNDPSSEPNLLRYIRQNSNIDVNPEYFYVDLASDDIFNYPFLFITGHGNIDLTETEAKRLRAYCDAGGFVYVDDDYGLDKAIRRELKKVFPEQEMQELPFSYGLFHCHYDFPSGMPKTHEHDGKAAEAFGLFEGKRLAVLYTYESNPSDGWADPDAHGDTDAKREESLKIGTNIIVWALSQ